MIKQHIKKQVIVSTEAKVYITYYSLGLSSNTELKKLTFCKCAQQTTFHFYTKHLSERMLIHVSTCCEKYDKT
jgi:hypothetical protein